MKAFVDITGYEMAITKCIALLLLQGTEVNNSDICGQSTLIIVAKIGYQ